LIYDGYEGGFGVWRSSERRTGRAGIVTLVSAARSMTLSSNDFLAATLRFRKTSTWCVRKRTSVPVPYDDEDEGEEE
jgi:hypothetical protein